MSEENDEQIPWDAFWWRNPVVRNITRNGDTHQEKWRPPSGSTPVFMFDPNNDNFWEVELAKALENTDSVIYVRDDGHIAVWGNGVKLAMPRFWLESLSSDDLVIRIIKGMEVSIRHRMRLGY